MFIAQVLVGPSIKRHKEIVQIEITWLKITTDKRQNSWLFTSVAEELGALSRQFCYILVKTAQIFDKEPVFKHKIAHTTLGRKY